MLKYIILLILLLAPSLAQSAEVTDATVVGTTINISGSSFGTKPQASPVFYDDLEDGTLGEPLGGDWDIATTNPPYYDDTTTANPSSTKVAKFFATRDEDAMNANSTYVDDITTTGQDIYVNMWMWYDHGNGVDLDGLPHENYQVKPFRITEGTSSDQSMYGHGVNMFCWNNDINTHALYQVPSSYAGEMIPSNSNADVPPRADVTAGILFHKFWFNVQLVLKQASDVDVFDAVYEHSFSYKDGVQAYFVGGLPNVNSTSFTNRPADKPNPYRSVLFQNFIDALSGSTTTYYDDVYIDNTLQRVEIGDNQVYANCTHREIQIPTAWNDTSITVTARQGSLPDGNYYLFVVDEDNIPSEGYPITLGSTQTSVRVTGNITIQ